MSGGDILLTRTWVWLVSRTIDRPRQEVLLGRSTPRGSVRDPTQAARWYPFGTRFTMGRR